MERLIMALKSKAQDEIIPEEVTEQKQVTWDDLEFEAEYVPEEELESRKFYTISGKESEYEPTWEKYTIADLEVGDEFEGRPEITIFENEEQPVLAPEAVEETAEEVHEEEGCLSLRLLI